MKKAVLSVLLVACGGDEPGRPRPDLETWVTEAEYKFTGSAEQGALLSEVPSIRVDPERNRIFAIDLRDAQASAWTPEGTLVLAVGRVGAGPGEFMVPAEVYIAEDGSFSVRESHGSRFTYFTADGTLVETVPGPPTSVTYDGHPLATEAIAGDGSYFAVPLRRRTGVRPGTTEESRVEQSPLLRGRRSENAPWPPPEPIFRLNRRNSGIAVRAEAFDSYIRGPQPFADPDQWRTEPERAVVMRRTGGPGVVELIELDANGDTLWFRRLQFEPLEITPDMIAEARDRFVTTAAPFGISASELREAWDDALYRPEYFPAATGFALTASGEVWLGSFERSDTLKVFHVIGRGDLAGNPRRVLVPESLRVHDATDTHVRGIWKDELDVPYIVGRRLVRR